MTLICQRKDIYLHLEKIKRQKIMEMNQENQGQIHKNNNKLNKLKISL